MIRGVVFDLDDTLFLERDYVRSGFGRVAEFVSRSPVEAQHVARWLWRSFEAGTRGDTFDQLLAARSEIGVRFTVRQLVDEYRGHTPRIRLLPGIEQLMEELVGRNLRLGLLSDGPALSQLAKVDALDLRRWLDPIVLTEQHGPSYEKPGSAGFALIASGWGFQGHELAYVADNPQKDFVGPRLLGWFTLRLRMPGQLRSAVEPAGADDRPDIEISDPRELLDHLNTPVQPGQLLCGNR